MRFDRRKMFVLAVAVLLTSSMAAEVFAGPRGMSRRHQRRYYSYAPAMSAPAPAAQSPAPKAEPSTPAPQAQAPQRQYRSYSYDASQAPVMRSRTANRLPTWERADSKVMFRYGINPQ